jgi:threonine dehydrogenase-like Zn-dependent dehydrogenase
MQVVRVDEGGRVEVVDGAPVPVPGPGEVLVRVRAVGICGTDLEICHGTMGYYTQGRARYPIIPGHEWSGQVVALGTTTTGDGDGRVDHHLKVGDHVVGETCLPCWRCEDCVGDNYHRCAQRREAGIMNKDGAFAQYLAFPARSLHVVDRRVPFETACVIEPLTVAVRAVKMCVRPGDTVVVIGDGSIGLLVLLAARAYGAHAVLVAGTTPNRLAKARELGADATFDFSSTLASASASETVSASASDSFRRAVMALGDRGRLADVVIEAAGQPAAFESALMAVKDGGRVTVLGVFGGQRASVDLDQVVLRDLSIRGTVGSPGVWPETVALVESGQIAADAIITHRFEGLGRFPDALALVHARADNVIKAVLCPFPSTEEKVMG